MCRSKAAGGRRCHRQRICAGIRRIEQWLDALSTDGLRRWSANNRLIALLQLHERAKGRPE